MKKIAFLLLIGFCFKSNAQFRDANRFVSNHSLNVHLQSFNELKNNFSTLDFAIKKSPKVLLEQTSFKSDLKKVLPFAILTGATFFADRTINKAFFDLKKNSSFVDKVSPVITDLGGTYGVLILGGIGATSLITKDKQLQTTVFLAAKAYIASVVIVTGIKYLAGRTRPDVYNHWTGPSQIFKPEDKNIVPTPSFQSFASGHTTVSFAVATVFAEQYRNKPWVGVGAYTVATLIGLSRLTENKHWATDVMAGAMLGYLTGRTVVRNFKIRLNKKKATQKQDKAIHLNFDYNELSTSAVFTYKF